MFATETLPPIMAAQVGEESLAVLAHRIQQLRAAAHDTVRSHLQSTAFAQLWLRVGAWSAARSERHRGRAARRPLIATARAVLAKRDDVVCALGDRLAELSVDDLHAMRIRVKQFRYAADFFAPLFGAKSAPPLQKRLRKLQDALGWLNDAVVAQALLADVEEKAPASEAIAIARAGGLITGRLAVGLDSVRGNAERAYKKLARAKRFW